MFTLQLRLNDGICNFQSKTCILHTCDVFKFQCSVNKFCGNSSQNKYSCKMRNPNPFTNSSHFLSPISILHQPWLGWLVYFFTTQLCCYARYHDFWWVSFTHPRCHCFNCEKRLMSQRRVVNYCSITSFNAVPIIVASLFIFDACINAYLIIHFTAIPVACCECYVEKKNHKKTSYSRENFYLLHPASLPPFFV